MSILDKSQLHIKLKLLRLEHNLTQTELAKILGISRGCLANYETSKRQPDPQMLSRIGEYFNVSVDYLVNNVDIRFSFNNNEHREKFMSIENTINQYGNALDLSNMSTCGKIAIIEFFEYILAKESIEKHQRAMY